MIIPTAEPFLIPGGKIGVLLIHGFTGTPKEMREMGQSLAAAGFSVLAPRLAGHATLINDLNHVRWQDWLNTVEDGYHLLRGIAERIFVAGLSLGGMLSLLFASRFKVEGVVAMSTPYELPPDPRTKLLPILWPFIKAVPKGAPDWVDPTPALDHIDYPLYPTRTILQLQSLFTEMRAALPQVEAPVLLIHSQKDGGVSYDNMEKIATRLGSRDITRLSLQNSGHVIIRDLEKKKVFQETALFIQRVCNPT